MKKLGIFIIIIGLGLTILTGFTFFTKEKVIEVGDVALTTNKPHRMNWSPLVGVGVMAIGCIVLWQSNKK